MPVMRIRKTNALMGVAAAAAGLFLIYLVVDTININYEDAELQKVRQILIVLRARLPW
jgi:hypothetical protein